MTSKDLNWPQKNPLQLYLTVKPNRSKKRKLKGGANIEINDKYLDEIFHNINLYMELAMQIIFNDQTLRSNTVQDIKKFNSQSLSAQAKKGERIVSMMTANRKAFDLIWDDIVELSTENEAEK